MKKASSLPLIFLPATLLPRNLATKQLPMSYLMRIFSIPKLTIRKYWRTMLCTALSAVACRTTGLMGSRVIDPLIFKSVLIFFGLTMGFRNTYANQRRVQAMDHLHRLMAAFWGILVSLPRESRQKFHGPLVAALRAIIDHFPTVSDRRSYWYGVVGLHPVEAALPHAGRATVIPSPRALLVTTLLAIEEEIERIEQPPKQALRRNLWLHKQAVLNSYDTLITCTVPAVSDRYLAFMDMCRFFYSVALPFGISTHGIWLHNDRLRLHWPVPPEVILVLTTLMVTMVMYSLEELTQENEDPMRGYKEEDDLDLRHLDEVFDVAADGFDARCAAAQAAEPPMPGDIVMRPTKSVLLAVSDRCAASSRSDRGGWSPRSNPTLLDSFYLRAPLFGEEP